MTTLRNPASFVRHVALLEGVSFLVLLGIAMPLRHFAGMPRAVTVCGWIHGALFLLLGAALLRTRRLGWPGERTGKVLVAALLPFGPFVLDRRMRAWERGGASEGP